MLVPKHDKTLYCAVDNVLNDAWRRIQNWTLPQYPGSEIHKNAWTLPEILKDNVLPSAKEGLQLLSQQNDIVLIVTEDFKDEDYPDECLLEYMDNIQHWVDVNKLCYTDITCVTNMDEKISMYLTEHKNNLKNPLENILVIDDFSMAPQYYEPYTVLYNNAITQLYEENISYIEFNSRNDWENIINNMKPNIVYNMKSTDVFLAAARDKGFYI